MNKKLSYLLIALVLIVATAAIAYAQFGIGTTNPHPSAALDIVSTNQGVLHPRLTTAQRDAINGGDFAEGLTIYNDDDNCLQVWDGTSWNCIVGGSNTTSDYLSRGYSTSCQELGLWDPEEVIYSTDTGATAAGPPRVLVRTSDNQLYLRGQNTPATGNSQHYSHVLWPWKTHTHLPTTYDFSDVYVNIAPPYVGGQPLVPSKLLGMTPPSNSGHDDSRMFIEFTDGSQWVYVDGVYHTSASGGWLNRSITTFAGVMCAHTTDTQTCVDEQEYLNSSPEAAIDNNPNTVANNSVARYGAWVKFLTPDGSKLVDTDMLTNNGNTGIGYFYVTDSGKVYSMTPTSFGGSISSEIKEIDVDGKNVIRVVTLDFPLRSGLIAQHKIYFLTDDGFVYTTYASYDVSSGAPYNLANDPLTAANRMNESGIVDIGSKYDFVEFLSDDGRYLYDASVRTDSTVTSLNMAETGNHTAASVNVAADMIFTTRSGLRTNLLAYLGVDGEIYVSGNPATSRTEEVTFNPSSPQSFIPFSGPFEVNLGDGTLVDNYTNVVYKGATLADGFNCDATTSTCTGVSTSTNTVRDFWVAWSDYTRQGFSATYDLWTDDFYVGTRGNAPVAVGSANSVSKVYNPSMLYPNQCHFDQTPSHLGSSFVTIHALIPPIIE